MLKNRVLLGLIAILLVGYSNLASARYLQSDSIGLQGGNNTFGYVVANPVNAIDPRGLDTIYINYDYYPVSTPVGKLPLGHGGVVTVDPKTGFTKYFEFGRYGDTKGIVRSSGIPNVTIGKDGLPTQKSLSELYDFLSKNYGKSSNVSAEYFPNNDYQGTVDFANRFGKKHPDYNLWNNNCKTFGRTAATACVEGTKCR